jgi:hypothetical protein
MCRLFIWDVAASGTSLAATPLGEAEVTMSMEKGLTSWVLRAGHFGMAYRWNMRLRDAIHTFSIKRGQRLVVACGPLIVEW